MSVCDEGWGADIAGGTLFCPAFHWSNFDESMICGFEVFKDAEEPDTCPFANLLRALPSASDERLELALRVLVDGTVDTVRIAAAIAGIYQPPDPDWKIEWSGSSNESGERHLANDEGSDVCGVANRIGQPSPEPPPADVKPSTSDPSPEPCPECGGSGNVSVDLAYRNGSMKNMKVCPTCHGSGKVKP